MAVLKSAITAIDPTPDKKREITLALTLLSELCDVKAKELTAAIETELRTAGSVENKTIAVTEILARQTEYRAYVKQDAGKVATEVSAGIKKFISGTPTGIIDGIAGLVTTGIEAIIGAGSGAQHDFNSYFIVVQSYAIVRFDIRGWSRQVEASGITTQIETALAMVGFKSSVDVKRISLNTFLATYQDQLAKIGIPEAKWAEYLKTAEELYHKLRGEAPPAPNALLEAGFASDEINLLRKPGQLYGSFWDP